MAGAQWFLLLVSASCVLSVVVIDDLEVEKSWLQFKREHNKHYASIEEEEYRKNVFEKAVQRVFEHQLAYDRGEESYTLGINQFSDQSFEEWIGHRDITCEYASRDHRGDNSTEFIRQTIEELGDGQPKKINWETKGMVSPIVRNQNIGACGGCYAFAAASAIESSWAKAKGLAHKVPVLSEQEIIDCGRPYGCSGCKGGHPCSAYDAVKGLKGLAYAKDYPWRDKQVPVKPCAFKASDKKKFKEIVTISSYWEFNKPTHTDFNLYTAVGKKGPTTASVCVNQKFKDYKDGLFDDSTCYTSCFTVKNNGINHSVLAIGYDDDEFILRNSWGATWGIKGNMRIKRMKGEKDVGICGFGRDQSIPVI